MKRPDVAEARRLADHFAQQLARHTTKPWRIMEICGGQTQSIVKFGIDQLLPPHIELVHGPGCPVCVTPLEMVDRALSIAARPDVIFCSFGDMLRVPGSSSDLLQAKAQGADVRVLYSPLDALAIARSHPDKRVVFFAIGFETTAPANAMAIHRARERGLSNFSALCSHVLTPPAMTAILQDPAQRVQAFLGPGHVCSVTGTAEYLPIAEHYRVPIVISGFEPLDLLEGIWRAVQHLEAGLHGVDNQYSRVVQADGNRASQALLQEVFEVCDRKWRGIGLLPKSGLRLRYEYRAHDALRVFEVDDIVTEEPSECLSGQILRGVKKPTECPAFGTRCTPEHPLGATMVSSEGACAAYHAYGRAPVPSARLARGAAGAAS
ncbi:MAG TPA: hydrogenase formation protein HypD [Polyangiaceae bacterium]|jgi:hydrogenase expression/formation protein HypD